MISGCYLWYKFYKPFNYRIDIDLQKDYKDHLAPKKLAKKAKEEFKRIQKVNINSGKRIHSGKPISSKNLKEWLFRQSEKDSKGDLNFLRPFFNEYLRKIIKKKNLEIILPKEYLVIKSKSEVKDKYSYEDFFVISEKLDLKNYEENIKHIHNLSEKEKEKLAIKICDFIWNTGFVDSKFENLIFTKCGKYLTSIDNEPFKGFMRIKKIGQKKYNGSNFFDKVEVGLENLKTVTFKSLSKFHKFVVVNEDEIIDEVKRFIKEKKKVSEWRFEDFFYKDKHKKNPLFLFGERCKDYKFIYEKDFLKKYVNRDIFTVTANKYLKYIYLLKILRIFTIVLSVICPLIPLGVIISSVAYAALYNMSYYFKNSLATKKPTEKLA
jgi:hypothetical protein